MEQNYWRKCSVCKKEIPFNSTYYVCSVSSCNKKRAPTQFCSVSCWDAHNAVLNHMSAGADEEKSPSKDQWMAEQNNADRPRRRIVVNKTESSSAPSGDVPLDILVVVSKMKAYINAKGGMNTSGDVAPVLSDYIRRQCDQAIENARKDGRKTVMARDF
jgi:hypothetical protein